MKKPHKHAELIKQWLDGADIEVRFGKRHGWVACIPTWYVGYEYRVKPKVTLSQVAKLLINDLIRDSKEFGASYEDCRLNEFHEDAVSATKSHLESYILRLEQKENHDHRNPC